MKVSELRRRVNQNPKTHADFTVVVLITDKDGSEIAMEVSEVYWSYDDQAFFMLGAL